MLGLVFMRFMRSSESCCVQKLKVVIGTSITNQRQGVNNEM